MNNVGKNTAEMAPEPQETRREETKPTKREKPPKKPGSVSRFFNQFGIGKYWEKLNDYFEYEEKMEAAAAEKEAKKETAEAMKIAGEEAVGEIKARGTEMPAKIEASAARAGATSAEAAPIVAEAKAEEAKIEAEAEAAKADFDEEVPVFLAEPEGTSLPSTEEIIKAREVEELPGWEEMEEADVTKAELEKKEKEKVKELPKGEEFETEAEAVAKERAARAVVAEEAEIPAWEESEMADITKEEEARKKTATAKTEVSLPGWEDVKPFEFSAVARKKIEAGLWAPKIPDKLKARLPDIVSPIESAFFTKGEKMSKARVERMARSLEKAREAYAAQKAAKEISAVDEKVLKKLIAETKGIIEVAREKESEKAEKPKKKKPAKRRVA